MLDELLEVFERDRRGGDRGEKPKGFRARLARLFGGGQNNDYDDRDEDYRGRDKRHRDRRERDDRFDWGDD